jgi:pimeloyl-ACP methyl ester carboxylesterase
MMKSLWIRRNGVPLHGLWRTGQGAPIVVIPGVMADAESFEPAIAAMDRPEPVLILDRRGRFPSGEVGEGYSVATEVEDATAWLDHLGSPVIMVGWSYGATIALELAAGDDRVTNLVAYEPVLAPFGRDALPALRAADLGRRVEIVNRDISRFSRERVADLRRSPTWSVLSRLAAPLPEELTALDDFRPDPFRWSKIAAEMILGEDSRGVEPYGPAFERVRALLPLATQTILPGQGHLAHADDPAALGRLIAKLIGKSADARAQ